MPSADDGQHITAGIGRQVKLGQVYIFSVILNSNYEIFKLNKYSLIR